MATTRAADVDASIPEIWADDLYAQAENLTFWHNMEGEEGSGLPVIRKDELEKEAGDNIRIDIVLALTGDGQVGDTVSVEGNEEKLNFRQMNLPVNDLSHGVRWTKKGKILISHDMRQTALNQLAKWLSGKLDNQITNEMSGNGDSVIPDKNKFAAGTASSRATVADTDAGGRLTWNSIMEIKAWAQVELKIEPVKIEDGNEFFGLVAHPYALMELKRDDAKWAQAQREANVRGMDNPLFTGAAGIIDGVILYSSNRVPRSTNGSVQTADNVFFGAQALSRGYAYYPDWTEEYFDYGREQGIATYVIVGNRVNIFDLTAAGGATDANKTAIGSLVFYTAAVAPGQP